MALITYPKKKKKKGNMALIAVCLEFSNAHLELAHAIVLAHR